MWSRWTEKARAAIWAAHDLAAAQGQSEVEPEQLMFALLRDETNVAYRVLNLLEIDVHALRAQVLLALPKPETPAAAVGDQPKGAVIAPIVDAAYAAAWELDTNYIGTEHLLLGLLRHPTRVTDLLESAGANWERVRQVWENLNH